MAKKDNNKPQKSKALVPKSGGTLIQELDPIPTGEKQKVSEIGLTVFSKKATINMSLQFGKDTTWETIRVVSTDSTYPLKTNIVREGAEDKRFRLLLENDSSDDADVFYWIESQMLLIFN